MIGLYRNRIDAEEEIVDRHVVLYLIVLLAIKCGE